MNIDRFRMVFIVLVSILVGILLVNVIPFTVSITGSDIDSYYSIESDDLNVNITITARMTVADYDYRSLSGIIVTFTDVGSITLDVVDRESLTEVFAFNFVNYGTYIGQIVIKGIYIIDGNTKQITRTYDFILKIESDVEAIIDDNGGSASSFFVFDIAIAIVTIYLFGKLKTNKVKVEDGY